MKQKQLLIWTLLLVGVQLAQAQVHINEYSAANWQQFYDNHNDHEDWIELYNAGTTAADIGGFWISDDPADPQKFQFPAGTVIDANGFLIVWCSGRNRAENGVFHTGFKLTQTKNNPESLVLTNAQGLTVESVTTEKTAVHQSRCRSTDGAGTWKICTDPTLGASNNQSPQYDGFAKRPDMDQIAGFYAGSVTVTISVDEPDDEIYYTIDGTEPTKLSPKYTAPLVLDKTTVVKARSFNPSHAFLPSFIRFNTYFIDEDFTLPVFSVAAYQLQDLANGDKDLRPVGSIEFFDANKQRQSASYGELNSHGQDSWVNDQRSLDWISRDEMGYSKAIEYPLFKYSDRDEYQRFIFRAAGDDNYPATNASYHQGSCHLRDDYVQTLAKTGGMELDVRASDRAIVFLNGDYWGVYSIREIPDDHDYTDYYYNQGKYDVQFLETWGNTWAEYGGEGAFHDWGTMRKFILNNDMADPANYKKVTDSINVKSMVDYFLTNLNVVASDWLNYNTGWWRGRNPNGDHKKWGYILWDLDATFHYYINYSGVPNTNYNANPCDLETISNYIQNQFFNGEEADTCITYGIPPDTFFYCSRVNGKHEVLLLKLIQENPEFREFYYSRQTDLMNTVFSCDNMLHVFDSMAAVIAPEMPRHIARWGGSLTEWQQNIQKMRNFITQRCGYFDNGMLNCYHELNGPYPVTLLVEPPGAGKIDFNTLKLDQFPWTGNYFGGMGNKIKAKATGTLPFHHWESRSGNVVSPNLNTASAVINFTQSDTLVAVFSLASGAWAPEDDWAFNVYPTITSDQVNLDFVLPESGPLRIRLYSSLGQPVADWNLSATGGEQSLWLNLKEKQLPSGLYLLDFEAGTKHKSAKITYLR
jgi:hypothetical protein